MRGRAHFWAGSRRVRGSRGGHRAGGAPLQGQEARKQLLALGLQPQVLPPQPRCPQAALSAPSAGLGGAAAFLLLLRPDRPRGAGAGTQDVLWRA